MSADISSSLKAPANRPVPSLGINFLVVANMRDRLNGLLRDPPATNEEYREFSEELNIIHNILNRCADEIDTILESQSSSASKPSLE